MAVSHIAGKNVQVNTPFIASFSKGCLPLSFYGVNIAANGNNFHMNCWRLF